MMSSQEPGGVNVDGAETALTVKIVAAYVRGNQLPANDIPNVIASVFSALKNVAAPVAAEPVRQEPAVTVKKSITPDYLVCLEDGKKLKMLKRHLQTAYGLSPDAYRAKWGLPPDYPMVAPNYAKTRSDFAKTFGLGRRPAAAIEPLPIKRASKKVTEAASAVPAPRKRAAKTTA